MSKKKTAKVSKKAAKKKASKKISAKKPASKTPEQHFSDWWVKVAQKKVNKIIDQQKDSVEIVKAQL